MSKDGACPAISLDAFISMLTGPKAKVKAPGSAPFTLYRWDAHAPVHLAVWPSMADQTKALARLSFFLEDAALHGQVIKEFPVGRQGGVLAYSGHNMRSSDIVDFLHAASEGSVELWPEEQQLVGALVDVGVLSRIGSDYAPTK